MSLEKPVVAVIGAGAVGGYYGARLAQAGFEVHLLTRGDSAHIREHGIQIQSCDGDFSLSPTQIHAHANSSEMPPADLVLVTLKTVANQHLKELIEPILKPDSVILTIQNGLGNEELLKDLFGKPRVMGGMAFVCINRLGPGVISHTDHGLIRLGEVVGPAGDRARQIAQIFKASRIKCEAIDDLAHARWEKLLWNIPFNGLGAVMDLTTDRLIDSESGVELVSKVMGEVIETCRPLGIVFEPNIVQEKIRYTRTMGSYRTSTQIDRQLKRPFEIEAIFGKPIRISRSFGVATPFITSIYDMLKAIDSSAP